MSARVSPCAEVSNPDFRTIVCCRSTSSSLTPATSVVSGKNSSDMVLPFHDWWCGPRSLVSSREWMNPASRLVRRDGGKCTGSMSARSACVMVFQGTAPSGCRQAAGHGVFPSDRECPDNLLSLCMVLRSDPPEIVRCGLGAVPCHIVPPSNASPPRKPLAPKKEREKKKAGDLSGNAERKRKAAFMPPEASVCKRKAACVHFSLAFPPPSPP